MGFDSIKWSEVIKNSVAWVCVRIIPTERPPLVGEVNDNFADRGCHLVSMTDHYGRILSFLDRTELIKDIKKSYWTASGLSPFSWRTVTYVSIDRKPCRSRMLLDVLMKLPISSSKIYAVPHVINTSLCWMGYKGSFHKRDETWH
jgi:hypothetical protein